MGEPTQYAGGYGGLHGGSPGFGRSQISRQFTEAESALDERLTSHLTAPPIQMRVGDSIGQSYKWLSEDLALRSTLSGQLAGEQRMAYAQSERHELRNQAIQQEEMDAELLDGIAYANDLLATGEAVGAKDATYKSMLRNPGLGLNPRASKVFGDLERTFESPEQSELRQLKMDLEVVTAGNSKFAADDVSRLNAELDEEDRSARISKQALLNKNTMDNNVLLEGIRGYNVRAASRKSKEAADLFNAIGDPENETAQIQIQGMFTDLGLGDVDIYGPGKDVLRGEMTRNVVFDPIGRAEILDTPEKEQAYTEALKMTLGSEPGTAEFKEGKKVIDSISYQWIKRNGDKLQEQKMNARREEVARDFEGSWGTIDKEIFDIYKLKDISDKEKSAMILNTHARRFDKFVGGAGKEVVVKYLDDIAVKLTALDGDDPPDAAAINEFTTVNSLQFAQEYQEAKLQSALGNTKKIAKAVDSATEIAKPQSKAERDALPAGTSYIGPDGLQYTKK